ncbi:MAG: hypothetical protein RL030_2687, partial [Pseudomonadota bacterium]
MAQCDGGVKIGRMAGQFSELRNTSFAIAGLVQDFPTCGEPQACNLVAANYQRLGPEAMHPAGFLHREAQSALHGRFAGLRGFIDLRGVAFKGNSQSGEQGAAVHRGRCQ